MLDALAAILHDVAVDVIVAIIVHYLVSTDRS